MCIPGMNSRDKGARGERELAEVLRAHGFEARRGQQFHGGAGSPDVISNIPNVHLECKRVEAGNPYVWLEQAIRDAGGAVPVVAHKRNRRDWIAILPLGDLLTIFHQLADRSADSAGCRLDPNIADAPTLRD